MKHTHRAADAIVERLIAHEVRHAFAVAGESYLDVLHALYDARGDLQVVICRHEAAAANMAEARRVEKTADFASAPGAARAQDGPALIEVLTSIKDISPGRRLSALN